LTDILKGLAGGGWSFLVSWVFPSAALSSLFASIVFPHLEHLPMAKEVAELKLAQRLLVLAFISVMLGLLLSATSTFLYRLLEGYHLPSKIYRSMTETQVAIKHEMMRALGRTPKAAPNKNENKKNPSLSSRRRGAMGLLDRWRKTRIHSTNREVLREQLHRFPVEDDQVRPTRFGNGMRAFETYAQNRYNLSSQVLWTELISAVPQALRDEQEQARASVNFFVSLIYLSGLFGLSALLTFWRTSEDNKSLLLISGGIALLFCPIWYRLAVMTTSYWHSTVQALVNMGRKEVAAQLGLQIPLELEEERNMWRYVTWFVYEDYRPQWADALRKYRQDPRSVLSDSQPSATGSAAREDGSAGTGSRQTSDESDSEEGAIKDPAEG
jgi:hypothetical protein